MKAFNWVGEVLSVGAWKIMRIELRGEVPCQELECGVEHLSVFRQVVGFVLGATGLVSAAYLGDFIGYNFLGGGSCEIAVVCRAI